LKQQQCSNNSKPRLSGKRQAEGKKMVHHVKVIETGEVVEIYFYHKDGVAYVGKNGIKILFEGEYEEID
jgi:hypothetical protein